MNFGNETHDNLFSGLRIPAETKLVHFEDVFKIAEDNGAVKLTQSSLDLRSLPDSYMKGVNSLIREKSQVQIQ